MAKRNHLGDFPRGRIIGKLEHGRSLTSVAEVLGMNKRVVPRSWKTFQTLGTAIRKFGEGHARKRTAVDDQDPDTSQQVPLLSNFVQQKGDKCCGLLCPDVFTKVAYFPVVLNAAYL
ncbi:uncharacterized protein TNCV_3627411 [Trichonephila clavipes]|nr:uncharacterized protein TNCV_3627411 [Trichonephila clavipes]